MSSGEVYFLSTGWPAKRDVRAALRGRELLEDPSSEFSRSGGPPMMQYSQTKSVVDICVDCVSG